MMGPPPFNLTPDNTPRTEWPINRLQPVIDFYDLCSNAAADFVPGFGPDSVNNSKAGKYCKRKMIEVLPYAGKVASQFQVPVPVIRVRPKFFLRSLALARGDVDEATRICEGLSLRAEADPVLCMAAADIYKNVYKGDIPRIPLSYREDFRENFSLPETAVVEVPPELLAVKKGAEKTYPSHITTILACFLLVSLLLFFASAKQG